MTSLNYEVSVWSFLPPPHLPPPPPQPPLPPKPNVGQSCECQVCSVIPDRSTWEKSILKRKKERKSNISLVGGVVGCPSAWVFVSYIYLSDICTLKAVCSTIPIALVLCRHILGNLLPTEKKNFKKTKNKKKKQKKTTIRPPPPPLFFFLFFFSFSFLFLSPPRKRRVYKFIIILCNLPLRPLLPRMWGMHV